MRIEGERLRIGVVGLRFGTQVHVPAFRLDPRCEVVGLVSRDAERGAQVARDLGVPMVFGDWRELVAAPAVDAVSIAVPPAVQAGIVVEAARQGKHVFCEKPLGASLADARVAAASVEAAGVVHGIDFIFPEVDAWQRARDLITQGAIGRVVHFAYCWRVETFVSRNNLETWKARPDEGGGALGNFVSHVFYNVEWLLGPIRALDGFVCSTGPRVGRAIDGVMELDAGPTGTLSVCTDAFLGNGHRVEVYGDEGTLVLHNPTTDYVRGFRVEVGTRDAPHLTSRSAGEAAPSGDGRLLAVSRLIRRFVDAIDSSGTMTPNLAHGLRVQELLSLAAATADRSIGRPAAPSAARSS